MSELIGQTLGQYRIIEQIGEGGMATVYKAYQPGLDRYVAIKVLPPIHAKQPGFSERFEREAKGQPQSNQPLAADRFLSPTTRSMTSIRTGGREALPKICLIL
jgi:serine/threonine protein kinase